MFAVLHFFFFFSHVCKRTHGGVHSWKMIWKKDLWSYMSTAPVSFKAGHFFRYLTGKNGTALKDEHIEICVTLEGVEIF